MRQKRQYYVYILTNKSSTLYTGITSDIRKRVYEHKNKLVAGFTKKYNINRLIYFETFSDVFSAITREKTIKGWLRKKKIALVASTNPDWKDLNCDWYERDSSASPQNDKCVCHSERSVSEVKNPAFAKKRDSSASPQNDI